MRYLRPIPRRLLPDDMLVLPSDGQGGYGDARMVRHVRLELADDVVDDPHRDSARSGRVFMDAVNSREPSRCPRAAAWSWGHSPACAC